MKHDRRKQYKAHLEFFARTFKLKPPYQVICDSTFLFHFVSQHLGTDATELKRLIGTVLDTADLTLFVVDSAIKELEALKEDDALKLANQLERLRVGRDAEESLSIPPPRAIRKLVGILNPKRYVIATMDDELADHMRGVPGVPIIFMRRVMIGLEAPSVASRNYWKKLEENKMKVPKIERKRLFHVDPTNNKDEEDPSEERSKRGHVKNRNVRSKRLKPIVTS